jgi:hypothetical protein
MDFAFEVFLTGSDQISGFSPGLVTQNEKKEIEHFGEAMVWQTGKYSYMELNGAFVHKKWLTGFLALPKEVLADTLRSRVCEEVALNFFVSSNTTLPPRWINAFSWSSPVPYNYDAQNIPTCLSKMEKHFDRLPLVISAARYQHILDTWSFF